MTNPSLRVAGFGVLAVSAAAVWFLMAPAPPAAAQFDLSVRDYARLINVALDDHDANEARADSAPKQQVVNGWVARDLLTIIAWQQTDLLEALGSLGDQNSSVVSAVAVRDDRVPALLGLVVLALCWAGLTEPKASRGPSTAAADSMGGPS
jgi:hypothetical protein